MRPKLFNYTTSWFLKSFLPYTSCTYTFLTSKLPLYIMIFYGINIKYSVWLCKYSSQLSHAVYYDYIYFVFFSTIFFFLHNYFSTVKTCMFSFFLSLAYFSIYQSQIYTQIFPLSTLVTSDSLSALFLFPLETSLLEPSTPALVGLILRHVTLPSSWD